MEVQRQYNLRNRKVPINPPKKGQTEAPTSSQTKVDPPKEIPEKRETTIKEVEKGQ